MRTTVDIPEELLRTAKERASHQGQSLSRLLQQALYSHLQQKDARAEGEFELIVCGTPGGEFPSPAQVYELLDAEDRGRS